MRMPATVFSCVAADLNCCRAHVQCQGHDNPLPVPRHDTFATNNTHSNTNKLADACMV